MGNRFSPRFFLRFVLTVSGFWLLLIYPILNWFFWDRLPTSMRTGGSDFGQYYAGGLAARHGLWKELYPVPNKEIYGNPPTFRPLLHTPLFNAAVPEIYQGNWAFYPSVALPTASDVSPKLLDLCPRLQGDWHYIYPPPLALLLWPLGLFDYQTASQGVWFTLMCTSIFGTSYFSSRICRILWGGDSYMEGWVAILPSLPTWLGSTMSTTLAIGNASPLLGFLITLGAYSWLRNRQGMLGISLISAVLFKGIGLSWCPLLLVKPMKTKTLAVLAALTLLLTGTSIFAGGIDLYRTFFTKILPKAEIPCGVSLPGEAMTFLGIDLKMFFFILNLILVGVLYFGYWRARNSSDRNPELIIATLAGTIAVFCLCNPVVWPHHYFVNYLELPFSGWILWEGFQAQGKWRIVIFGMFALSFLFLLDAVLLLKSSLFIGWLIHFGVYNERLATIRSLINGLVVYALAPFEAAFLLSLAYRRLFFLPSSILMPAS